MCWFKINFETGVLFQLKMLTIKSWFSMQLVTVLSNLLSSGSLSVCRLSGHHTKDWNVTKLLLLQGVLCSTVSRMKGIRNI